MRCLPVAPGNEWESCFCQQALPDEDGECPCTWHAMEASLAQVLLLFKKGLLILEDTLNSGNCGDLDLSRIHFSSMANWFV